MFKLDRRAMMMSAAAVALPAVTFPTFAFAQRPFPSVADLAVPPDGINEAAYVQLGGMEQWVTIRGQDRKNPILLILPGGPGGYKSDIPHHFLPFERSFTVVQWDQPGTGKTYAKGKVFGPDITLDKIAADGVELAGLLKRRLGTDKLVLLGESFGSILGLMMINKAPSAFSAYAAVGQVVSFEQRAEYARALCMRIAEDLGDTEVLAQLKAMTPPYWKAPEPRQTLDRISRNYIRGNRLPPLWGILAQPSTPNWTLADRAAAQEGAQKSAERFRPLVDTFEASSLGSRFDVPIVVIQGEDDHHTPTPVSRRWLRGVTAPKTAFVYIPDGRHTILSSHPMETLRALERTLRPFGLAGGAVDPAIFQRYLGRYQLAPGFIFTLTMRENVLVGGAMGQIFPLQPETANTFYIAEIDTNVRLDLAADGGATAMTLQSGDMILKGPKVG